MRFFEYYIDSEDDNVFAIETDSKGNWLPGDEGIKGPRTFKILSNGDLKRVPREASARWLRRAWKVSKEEAFKAAGIY